MNIKKILWPTDLSENAARALPLVNSLAEKYQADVFLLYVAENLKEYGHFWGRPSHFLDDWQKEVVKEAESRMEQICRSDLGGCPNYRTQVVTGDPAQEILRTIENEGVDLVVMATHGHGWATHEHAGYVFGSVSEEVVKNAPVPVLTINPVKQKT
jgi:nucleotide-binding universal stress UspA family protein